MKSMFSRCDVIRISAAMAATAVQMVLVASLFAYHGVGAV